MITCGFAGSPETTETKAPDKSQGFLFVYWQKSCPKIGFEYSSGSSHNRGDVIFLAMQAAKRMRPSPIFNPMGNDDIGHRTMWFGETTNLMQLNDVRYSWATKLYNQMRENIWIPQKVDLTGDVTDYNLLTDSERRAYDGILSYLTFLDSVQSANLPQVKMPITAPEISMCLGEQISQEIMHNESYQVIIEAVIPSERRTDIYDFWRSDPTLKNRCEAIASIYQDYLDEPTIENYFYALIADYLLEGLYFYNGFCAYYCLAARNLMGGTADMIRYINRDEQLHVKLFEKLVTEAMTSMDHDVNRIYEMFAMAVEHECRWTDHIIGDNFLGITSQSTENYTKYLANSRLKRIGLAPLYENVKNPYKHLERFADVSGEGNVKGNFFETTITSYNMSSAVSGWDQI